MFREIYLPNLHVNILYIVKLTIARLLGEIALLPLITIWFKAAVNPKNAWILLHSGTSVRGLYTILNNHLFSPMIPIGIGVIPNKHPLNMTIFALIISKVLVIYLYSQFMIYPYLYRAKLVESDSRRADLRYVCAGWDYGCHCQARQYNRMEYLAVKHEPVMTKIYPLTFSLCLSANIAKYYDFAQVVCFEQRAREIYFQ